MGPHFVHAMQPWSFTDAQGRVHIGRDLGWREALRWQPRFAFAGNDPAAQEEVISRLIRRVFPAKPRYWVTVPRKRALWLGLPLLAAAVALLVTHHALAALAPALVMILALGPGRARSVDAVSPIAGAATDGAHRPAFYAGGAEPAAPVDPNDLLEQQLRAAQAVAGPVEHRGLSYATMIANVQHAFPGAPQQWDSTDGTMPMRVVCAYFGMLPVVEARDRVSQVRALAIARPVDDSQSMASEDAALANG